jgi:HAD superfamily hydrolase (TIGR01509 family)
MSKAFIFDMDGVLVNSEQVWIKYENNLLERILGKDLSQQIGSTIGVSVNLVYDKVRALGFSMTREDFQKIYDGVASVVYKEVTITKGVGQLVEFLVKKDFKIALVSSSAQSWINQVLQKLTFKDRFEIVISVNDRRDLKPKPSPDGYLETIERLQSTPDKTIIIEDSNAGIVAAKASGAFTVAFTQNLLDGYKQIEIADAKAKNMEEVTGIVKNWLKFN